LCLCLALALCCPWWARADSPPPVDFGRDVLPLFRDRCYQCHDGRKQKSGLRLDVRSAALRGGESGKPAVVPGASGKSELIRRVTTAQGDEAMPPGKQKLTADQAQLLRAWIDAGAPWPGALSNEGSGHWAFQAPRRPSLPAVKNPAWVRNEIDRFLLARLEREGLTPSPEADRLTLIRRLSLDLLGLPPTPEEVDAFLADRADGAYERL